MLDEHTDHRKHIPSLALVVERYRIDVVHIHHVNTVSQVQVLHLVVHLGQLSQPQYLLRLVSIHSTDN